MATTETKPITEEDIKSWRYRLWLSDERGNKTELASAAGSPFWTEIWNLAKSIYGEEKISITFE